jgi:hypothetical protein
MEASPMFYGYYDGTYSFNFNGYSYDFPLAFFLVMLCIMIVNLIVIVVSSAKSLYKRFSNIYFVSITVDKYKSEVCFPENKLNYIT